MSLKAFHVVFVTLSVALCVGYAVWSFNNYQRTGGAFDAVLAVLGFVAAAGLVVYGVLFYRKIRKGAL